MRTFESCMFWDVTASVAAFIVDLLITHGFPPRSSVH
jgi:hypothetical protein